MHTFSLLLFLAACAGDETGKTQESLPVAVDGDGDGYVSDEDCNDDDANVHAGAAELCNGVDDDCDGAVDDDPTDGESFFVDSDGDGYGAGDPVVACEAGTGLTTVSGDCDDSSALYFPGADESDCEDPNDYNCDGSVGGADADADGFTACDDCNDDNSAVNPDGVEACDGIDNDCDGVTDPDTAEGAGTFYADNDGDGYGVDDDTVTACTQPSGYAAEGSDCDDADELYHPGARESDCTDPNDYNCDGSVGYADADTDGVPACEDCDDANGAAYPGAPEVCDGADNDCDGEIDPDSAEGAGTWYADADADTYGDADVSTISCAAPEGFVGDDQDCDDTTDTAYPGGTEVCDGVDNDCDGAVDDGSSSSAIFYRDADGDGFGDPDASLAACEAPVGYVEDKTDCDDTDAAISPFGAEVCDGVDNDCDGETDEDSATDAGTWYADVDADDFGDAASTVTACYAPTGYVGDATDCDDRDGDVNPDGTEVCGGGDENCDGSVDETSAADAPTWYGDTDGDGYGVSTSTRRACTMPAGFVENAGDCDDADTAFHPGAAETDCADPADYNCDGSTGFADADADGWAACEDCDDGAASVNPGASEVCDASNVDEDCDGTADDADTSAVGKGTFYVDGDSDGFGSTTSVSVCDATAGLVSNQTDCDDTKSGVNPGAPEICDGGDVDEDCDGSADDADASVSVATMSTWYGDADRDSYGDLAASIRACDLPATYVTNADDCNDSAAAINPAATEVCDPANVDEDCDDAADDVDTAATGKSTWYRDGDSDGYGGTSTVAACDLPTGYLTTSTDCNDGDAAINPGATEVCDASDVDEDCDGTADDADASATGKSTVYADGDGDGYGAGAPATYCDPGPSFVANADDCDDGRSAINPGATEVCDTLNTDEDCDGAKDDADSSATGKGTWYQDVDSDGYAGTSTGLYCDAPAGWYATSTDCNDSNASVNPGAAEVCDSANVDEDCDSTSDDADASATGQTTWYLDGDSDGYGGPTSVSTCDAPSGYLSTSTDCNDASSAIHPGAAEVCDASNVDEDCDGAADDADTSASGKSAVYADTDGDGYGSDTLLIVCDVPGGYVEDTTDCNDGDAAISPAATEVCDPANTDEDCDGLADDTDSAASGKSTFFEDVDGDGYGGETSTSACDLPVGYTTTSEDCDDLAYGVNPAAAEICDALDTDEDCSGLADDEDPSATGQTSWYFDGDLDGFGDELIEEIACDAPAGHIADGTDCDDGDFAINPDAAEVCDTANTDEDCNGLADDDDAGASGKTSYYTDADSDGYGGDTLELACDPGGGVVTNTDDCDDTEPAINPAATEVCDEVDDDCDGLIDDADGSLVGIDWYIDFDGDGYGAGEIYATQCSQPDPDTIDNADDCNDEDLDISPDATEVCEDGIDNDCSGVDTCHDHGLISATSADAGFAGATNGTGSAPGFMGATIAAGWYDVTGDGYPDVAPADYLFDATSSNDNRGRVYIMRGSASGVTDTVASPGATITSSGTTTGDRMGATVAFVSDVDSDGDDELLVGAFAYNVTSPAYTDGGGAWLYKGGSTLTGALGQSDAAVIINGSSASEYVGWGTGDGGDLNGDGVNDWIVSGYAALSASNRLGKVAVVSGGLANGTYSITSSSMTATLSGDVAGDSIGSSVLGNIDLDADGYPSLLVASANNAKVYVFDGPFSGALSLSSADTVVTGVSIYTDTSNLVGGTRSLVNGGDFNLDGYDDLLVGADGDDNGGASTQNYGAAYLLHGGDIVNGDLATQADASIHGYAASDFLGRGVGAGDIDGDGNQDLLVGASGFDTPFSGGGGAALLYGPVAGTYSFSATFSSDNVALIYGDVASAAFGSVTMGAGDLDDDGFEDFIVGAPGWAATSGGTKYGKAFLWYGTGE